MIYQNIYFQMEEILDFSCVLSRKSNTGLSLGTVLVTGWLTTDLWGVLTVTLQFIVVSSYFSMKILVWWQKVMWQCIIGWYVNCMRTMRKRFSSRRRHSEMRLNYRLLSSNSLLREDNYEATERRGYDLKGFCAFFPEEGNTCTVIMLLQPL